MTNFQIRSKILWCLRVILILQTAFFMPSLPFPDLFSLPLNSVALPALMCCAFALGACMPWKDKWHFIFDLLILAGAVFLFPGRIFVMCFFAGALLKMELADDADIPVSLSEFASAFCWGVGIFVLIRRWDMLCWLVPVILLLTASVCNHYSGIRENRFVSAVLLLIMIIGVWFALPQIMTQETQETGHPAETYPDKAEEDFEILPYLAIQVFSDGAGKKNAGTYSAVVFDRSCEVVPKLAYDCDLYYCELALPQSPEENIYFTRPFYESVLNVMEYGDACLVVRVPVPRSDPREEQIAAVIAATLPGKTAQLHGPFHRYLAVRKDGTLPDLSPELFAERIIKDRLNTDLIAPYAALQSIHASTVPRGGLINTPDDPQLLSASGIDLPEDHTEPVRDFLKRYLLWGFVCVLVIYLLCRYFINWSPGHKPVFHFIEKGICCGGAAAVFFLECWRNPVQDQTLFLISGGMILFLISFLSRIRRNVLLWLILIITSLLYLLFLFYYRNIPFFVFFLMCGLLVIDHDLLRERFFLQEEQLPDLYCISIFSGAMAFTAITALLLFLPELDPIMIWLLTALLFCHGIYSFMPARFGKRRSSP